VRNTHVSEDDYTFFIRTRRSFFAQNLRKIPASAKEQSFKF